MIEPERLILKPLTYKQLTKYMRLDNSLETELKLNTSSRTISADLKEALEQTILPNVANSRNNYLFLTCDVSLKSAVLFYNTLNMSSKKILLLVFTTLT